MEIPPWLQISPQMYLQAAEAGTRMGMEGRQLADSEAEAGNRDRLQAQELADNQKSAQQRIAQQAMSEANARQYQQQELAQKQAQMAQEGRLSEEQIQQKSFENMVNQQMAAAQEDQTQQNKLAELGINAAKLAQPDYMKGGDGSIWKLDANGTATMIPGTEKHTDNAGTPSKITLDEPAILPTEAIPASPAIPASSTFGLHFWPFGSKGSPGSPGSPAVPGLPARKITVTVPPGVDPTTYNPSISLPSSPTETATNSLPDIGAGGSHGTQTIRTAGGRTFTIQPVDQPAGQANPPGNPPDPAGAPAADAVAAPVIPDQTAILNALYKMYGSDLDLLDLHSRLDSLQ